MSLDSAMTDLSFARDVIDRLDGWVDELVAPLMPLRALPRNDGYVRLEFRLHLPHTVMVGKLVRATSGLRAAMVLSDLGYITESGTLLRAVSDFCMEVKAIAEALHRGGEPPQSVKDFVAQYFQPKSTTPEEYAAAEKVRYVSREELMKADIRMAQGTPVDGEKMRMLRRFINMTSDAYVHGAYETTMELYDPRVRRFAMRGHPDPEVRHEHAEAVALKLHEVVAAIELTAAMTSAESVFAAARDARRAMDARVPWKMGSDESQAP